MAMRSSSHSLNPAILLQGNPAISSHGRLLVDAVVVSIVDEELVDVVIGRLDVAAKKTEVSSITSEACIGVLGIQDICHFTSRDIGYYPFYFQGYGILGSILPLLPGILKI